MRWIWRIFRFIGIAAMLEFKSLTAVVYSFIADLVVYRALSTMITAAMTDTIR